MSKGTRAGMPRTAERAASSGANGTSRNSGAAIEMTLGEILELYNEGIGNLPLGKAGLNGYNKAVGDRIMLQPFSLTDEVRQKITKAKFILRFYFDELDKQERERITHEVMNHDDAHFVPADDEARQALWAHKYAEAMKTKHEVTGLHVFKREDFFRENKNPIPNVTEIALYPITEGSPWREKRGLDTPARAAGSDDPPGGETER